MSSCIAKNVAYLLLVLACCWHEVTSESAGIKWPAGDARWCLQSSDKQTSKVQRFEVLPGLGWDNLLNIETAPVVTYTYNRCKLTDDGAFLLPDNVYAVPLKMSKMETFAELINGWQRSNSLTSRTINASPGFSMAGSSISGKFSHEHEMVKSKQIEDSSVVIRVQLRYNRYEAKLRPSAELSREFKASLLNIAAFLEMNHTYHARHESEVLVRNFGTHVLTSVMAGAALVKDDYVKRKFIEQNSDSKSSILASASGTFKRTFSLGLDVDGSSKTERTKIEKYNKSLTHSYIVTHGGGVFLPGGGMKAQDWASSLDKNLVAMDRAGDPIYFYVTPQTLADVPKERVEQVKKMVREAVELYYQMNVIAGCTDFSSPKFSFSANFDDGSCKTKAETGLTLGGMYQTCTVSGSYLSHNPCQDLVQKNALTGDLSCPSGFQKVLLHRGSKDAAPEYQRQCHRCRKFLKRKHCCRQTVYQAQAHYEAYWCSGHSGNLKHADTGASKDSSPKQTKGYSFGGVYTWNTDNLVTGDKTCPPGFRPRQMFSSLQVCTSDDFEKDSAFSVPFGGFFSCSMGNPLAAHGSTKPSDWPQRCPTGYSQHLATEDNGCAIHYCVESGAMSGPNLPKVKRPPFSQAPSALPEKNGEIVFDAVSKTWMLVPDQPEAKPLSGSGELRLCSKKEKEGDEETEESKKAREHYIIYGILSTVLGGVVCLLTVLLVITVVKLRRQQIRPLSSKSPGSMSNVAFDETDDKAIIINTERTSSGSNSIY